MKRLLLTLFCFILIFTSANAQQDPINITKTDFFVDLGYGIHTPTNGYEYSDDMYQCEWRQGEFSFPRLGMSQYSKAIQDIDVQEFANDLEAAGAKYVILNLGQVDGKYCAPNPVYQQLMDINNYNNGNGIPDGYLTSVRDLPKDLIAVLKPKNIELFLYFNLDGPSQRRHWVKESDNPPTFKEYFVASSANGLQLEYDLTDAYKEDCVYGNGMGCFAPVLKCVVPPNDATGTVFKSLKDMNFSSNIRIKDAYVSNIADVIEYWAIEYGNDVSGWIFDHANVGKVDGVNETHVFNDTRMNTIRQAVLEGNPDGIVAFNLGTANSVNQTQARNLLDKTTSQDFHFGELNPCVPLDEIKNLWLNDGLYIKPNNAQTNHYNNKNAFQGRRVYRLDGNNNLDVSTSSQFHTLITMGTFWGKDDVAESGTPNPTRCEFNGNVNPGKTAANFKEYICESIKEGGVTTISIGNMIESGGNISTAQQNELNQIKSFVRDNNCGFNNHENLINIRRYNPSGNPIYANKDIVAFSNDNRADVNQHESDEQFDEWILEATTHTPLNSTTTYTGLTRFFNVDTKKYMTIREGSFNEGANYQQNIWNDYSSQKWIVEDVPGNPSLKRIKSFHNTLGNPAKSFYATVLYGSQWGGTPIINKPWENESFQKWEFIELNQVAVVKSSMHLESVESHIGIIPNPAVSETNISIDTNNDEKINRIELYNQHGVLLENKLVDKSSETKLYLNSYRPGLYFVKIHTDKASYYRKLIKF